MTLVNIALGSNIGDPPQNIKTAIDALCKLGTVTARSSLYLTKPWGITDQPDFCNAVVTLETEQKPDELLKSLKAIEQAMGRVKTIPWGPRLIDLDILTFDDISISQPDLTIPHPRMNERAFVLVPLAEIDPAFASRRDELPATTLAEVKLLSSR